MAHVYGFPYLKCLWVYLRINAFHPPLFAPEVSQCPHCLCCIFRVLVLCYFQYHCSHWCYCCERRMAGNSAIFRVACFSGTTAVSGGEGRWEGTRITEQRLESWAPLLIEGPGSWVTWPLIPNSLWPWVALSKRLELCASLPLLHLGSLGLQPWILWLGCWTCRYYFCCFSGSTSSVCSNPPSDALDVGYLQIPGVLGRGIFELQLFYQVQIERERRDKGSVLSITMMLTSSNPSVHPE